MRYDDFNRYIRNESWREMYYKFNELTPEQAIEIGNLFAQYGLAGLYKEAVRTDA